MRYTYRWRAISDARELYVIGEHELVKKAAENTFRSLGWAVKWRDSTLVHVPWGLLAKIHSEINTVGAVPTDKVSITLHMTNNPSVTLVNFSIYMKVRFFNKQAQSDRVAQFCDTFSLELRKFELPAIAASEWPSFLAQYPELRCSPIWGRGSWGQTTPVPAS